MCVGVCEKERLRESELERKRWRETEREECHSMTRSEDTFLSWFSPFSSEAVFLAFFSVVLVPTKGYLPDAL